MTFSHLCSGSVCGDHSSSAKQIRKVNKKLREIRRLEEKRDKEGYPFTEAEAKKVSKRPLLEKELCSLEASGCVCVCVLLTD